MRACRMMFVATMCLGLAPAIGAAEAPASTAGQGAQSGMDSMRHDAPAVSLAGATDQAATSGMRPMNHHAGAGQEGTADQAMMAGMQKMNRDMAAAPMTGNPDHDFAAMMLPHHQGAIDMARVELQYGKDRRMRQLAQRIVAAQKKEIAFMQHWLQSHVQK